MRYIAIALVTFWSVAVVETQNVGAPEFDVVSIKRNTANASLPGLPTGNGTGQYWLSNGYVETIIHYVYPTDAVPPEIVNLPAWAKSERYDVLAKGKLGPTLQETQQMWRALLADRLKLKTHYETRHQPGYNLLVARTDRQLGPQIKPSTLDCNQPQPTISLDALRGGVEAFAMKRCGFMVDMTPGGLASISGGTTMGALARYLSRFAMRPVVDRTGLKGDYAIRLDHAPASLSRPTDAPSVFIAVREQLGLKLEGATVTIQVLVIDQIERPTEN